MKPLKTKAPTESTSIKMPQIKTAATTLPEKGTIAYNAAKMATAKPVPNKITGKLPNAGMPEPGSMAYDVWQDSLARNGYKKPDTGKSTGNLVSRINNRLTKNKKSK